MNSYLDRVFFFAASSVPSPYQTSPNDATAN
jgi:hypothetical protein